VISRLFTAVALKKILQQRSNSAKNPLPKPS
jgi:hypothetical protein